MWLYTARKKKWSKTCFLGNNRKNKKQFTITLILSYSSMRKRERENIKMFRTTKKPKNAKQNQTREKQTRVERQQTNQEEGEKSCVKIVEENRTWRLRGRWRKKNVKIEPCTHSLSLKKMHSDTHTEMKKREAKWRTHSHRSACVNEGK